MELIEILYTGNDKQQQDLSTLDSQLVTVNFINSSFGDSNDYIELFIYDENGVLQLADYNAIDYSPGLTSNPKNDTFSSITLNPDADLKKRGYDRGTLNIQYNFYKTLFNSSIGKQYWIKEVSSSRTEIKLASQTISDINIQNGFNTYQNYISNRNYFPVFYLDFGNNETITATNVAYTEDNEGAYLLIKLYEPLPSNFDLKTQLWIVDKIAEPANFNVTIQVESTTIQNQNSLRGPNFNIEINSKNGQTTPYYTYASLLNSPVSSSYQKLLSYYQDKSVDINVDYSNFTNFIHFSSATERVNNFVYKVGLIESYAKQEYSQSLITGGSSNLLYASSSIGSIKQTVNSIIEKFDPYEYFLYFDSSSWAWPKRTTTQPYSLYSVTSSIALNFVGSENTTPTPTTQSLLFSASYYDTTNKDLLHNSVPQYLLDDSNNQPYITFLDMVAQHFDNIWLYYKDVSNRYNATNNPDTGISLDMVSEALKGLGINLYTNSNISNNLYYTLFGINEDGSLLPPTGSEKITAIGGTYVTSSIATISAKTIQDELYKRLYHNVPYLLKTKGTQRGIKALISSFGIPESILTVKEFGGNSLATTVGVFDVDTTNSKITIDTGSLGIVTGSLTISSSLLSPYTTIQYYTNNDRVNNTNLEVGFSTSDIINTNITASQGYFNIGQLIGNPADQYSSSYQSLVSASNAYFTTYTYPNSVWEYIRLIKFYNNSMFKMIKDFVPARANLSTGIIVKSHLYERNKYARHEPIASQFNNYEQAIDPVAISGSEAGMISGSTSWSDFIMTSSGSIAYTSSQNIEKYNGELSGSYIRITDLNSFADQTEQSKVNENVVYNFSRSLGALYQNITGSVRSTEFFDLDYNGNQLIPVNYGIITASLNNYTNDKYSTVNNIDNPLAQVQDYNYALSRSILPRYSGSQVVSAKYTDYTAGDTSYGKTAAIDKIKFQYAYVIDIYSSSIQLPNRANAQIKYIIDDNENILDLSKENTNIFTVQNVFKSGESVNVSLFNFNPSSTTAQVLSKKGGISLYEGGFRYNPVLYNMSASSNLTYEFETPYTQTTTVSSPSLETFSDATGNFAYANWSYQSINNYIPAFGGYFFQFTASCATSPAVANLQVGYRLETTEFGADLGKVPIEGNVAVSSSQQTFFVKTIIGAHPLHYNSPYITYVYQGLANPASTTTSTTYTSGAVDLYPKLYILPSRTEIQFSATQSLYYIDRPYFLSSSFTGSGIDPISLPFQIENGDMIRLFNTTNGWNRESEYKVISIRQENSGSTPWPYIIATVDRKVNFTDTDSGLIPSHCSKYMVLKHSPDETNLILDIRTDYNIPEDGVIFPKYIDLNVRENSGNVIKSLKAQNLI